MKTKYKYMKFVKRKEKWGEIFWECYDTKRSMLRGVIKKYGVKFDTTWFFSPERGMLFTNNYLCDIADFIEQLNSSAK